MDTENCKELCVIWALDVRPNEKLVLLALVDGPLTLAEIAARTGYSTRQTWTILQGLVGKDFIEQRGAGYCVHEKFSSPGDGKNFTDGHEKISALNARTHAGARGPVVVTSKDSKDSEIQERTTTGGGVPDKTPPPVPPQTWRGEKPHPRSLPKHGEGRKKTKAQSKKRSLDAERREVVQLALRLPEMAEHTARTLVQTYGAVRVKRVVGYAATYARRLSNPAGFVVAMLRQGWEPPDQRPSAFLATLERNGLTVADFVLH